MKQTAAFVCTTCGAPYRKWAGKCDACGGWNTISEETPLSTGPKSMGAKGRTIALSDLATEENPPSRASSGIGELDRVLGGGLVPASAILVGGDPGIGKSTLLLQAAASFARTGLKCMYISGEEAAAQVRMRAARLGLQLAQSDTTWDMLGQQVLMGRMNIPAPLVLGQVSFTQYSALLFKAQVSVNELTGEADPVNAMAKATSTPWTIAGRAGSFIRQSFGRGAGMGSRMIWDSLAFRIPRRASTTGPIRWMLMPLRMSVMSFARSASSSACSGLRSAALPASAKASRHCICCTKKVAGMAVLSCAPTLCPCNSHQ